MGCQMAGLNSVQAAVISDCGILYDVDGSWVTCMHMVLINCNCNNKDKGICLYIRKNLAILITYITLQKYLN